MASSREVTRTEQRIVEVDAMQQTVEHLQQDLEAYRSALQRELAALRQQVPPSAPAAKRPAPGQVALPPRPAPVELEPVEEEEPAASEPEVGVFRPIGSNAPVRMLESSEFDSAAPPPSPPSPFEMDDDGPEKIGGKPVSVLISDGTASEEPLSAWVIDRPPGGLRILVDEQLQVGMVIGVRPTREHPHAQWINVCIKNIRPERSSYVMMCTFVNRPPWNALALLNN